MNKTACRTAAMLLPLYAGEQLCEEAQSLVGAHLQVCDHSAPLSPDTAACWLTAAAN